jgi:hypothetical protein
MEGSGGNIFNYVFGSIFRRGEDRRGAKFLLDSRIAFPQIGGIWRGGEVCSLKLS